MSNHYIRQDIERRMILFGWSKREIVDFINDTLERELNIRRSVVSKEKSNGEKRSRGEIR